MTIRHLHPDPFKTAKKNIATCKKELFSSSGIVIIYVWTCVEVLLLF